MIDMHSHILPNIDDGAKSIEMSMRMARIYVANSFSRVVATPHLFDYSDSDYSSKILNSVKEMNGLFYDNGIELTVLPGNEIYVSANTVSDLLSDKALSINNGRYVLFELPSSDIPMDTANIIYELRLKGFSPILAHPERNSVIINNPDRLQDLVEMGAYAQLNLKSLDGFYGKAIKKTAFRFLKNELYSFIGTDSHSDGRRSPNVMHEMETLKSAVAKEYYWKLVYENPERALDDRPLSGAKEERQLNPRKLAGVFTHIF